METRDKRLLGTDRGTRWKVEGGRGVEEMRTKEAELCTSRRENTLGMTEALANLMAEKGGANRQGQRRQKWACGAELQGPRGTLDIRSREESKIREGMSGGGQM